MAISPARPRVFSTVIAPVHPSNPQSSFSMLGFPPQFLVTPEPSDILNFVLCKEHMSHLTAGACNVQDDLLAWSRPLPWWHVLAAHSSGWMFALVSFWALAACKGSRSCWSRTSCSLVPSRSFLCSFILAPCFSCLECVPASFAPG